MRDIRDLLATQALSKIRTCLDLLIEYDYIPKGKNLGETYENAIGVYNLDRENSEMWKMVWNNEISNLFQFDKQSGVEGIRLTKPSNVEDLATLNSVIRLMSSEPGAELPLEKYARFRKNPADWDKEMIAYGLNEYERGLMHSMFDYSNGIAAQQEDLYQVMTHPEIAGFSFGTADKLRKLVAKKHMGELAAFEAEYFENAQEKKLSQALVNYVWRAIVMPQAGYSFSC